MVKLMNRKIITHPGEPHLDDLFATALVLALDETVKTVERRNPTEEEMKDKNIWVLDQGSKIEPELLNFDHHHLKLGVVECTLSLIAKHFDMEEYLNNIPWFKQVVLMDSLGPVKAAEFLDCDANHFRAVYTPSDEFFLYQFKEKAFMDENDVLFQQLKHMGKNVIDMYYFEQDRLALLREKASFGKIEGLDVIYFLEDVKNPTMVIHKFAMENDISGGIGVTKDERGEGWCLRRLFEDPLIDLFKLEREDKVRFAHPAGFIAKVEVSTMDEINLLIGKSLK